MKKKPIIDYTSREFESIKNQLIQYAKKYYPDSYRDFSEAGFGSMMIDNVALVGDILSFYLDYQANESMLETSIEYNNVLAHSRAMGYKLQTNPSSYGSISIFLMVPSLPSAIGPDLTYAPVLRRGTEFSSSGGNTFILLGDVDLSDSASTTAVVGRVDEATGVPTYYAIKATGQIISGRLATKTFTIDEYQRFRKLDIGSNKVAEILSVIDSQGNQYYEVDNLTQNVIYKKIANRNGDKSDVPNILKPVAVPRRFTVERTVNGASIQFGYGSDQIFTEADILDPSNTTLDIFAKEYISDTSFDPYRLVNNDKLGIAPSNTILTITYRENSQENVNAASNAITRVQSAVFKFKNEGALNQSIVNFVSSTIECTNDSPIRGDVTIPTTEELKLRARANFATQKRCVTIEDYKSCIYNMPADYGAVKRANIYQDKDSFKRNLNLYVVSENTFGALSPTTGTLKQNIREWISMHKMVNDSIDILDARIVNFGISFRIVAEPDRNRYDVLQAAINKLAAEFIVKMDIGESISISNIYNILNEVDGVEDAVDVRILPKNGGNYSNTRFDFASNTSPDGRRIGGYENVIFELKLPSSDIQGSIV